ncbi:MAG: ABZJ_00895 family protein [Pseudomonadota bacterium]
MEDQERVPFLWHYLRVLVLMIIAVNVAAVLLALWSPVRIPAGTLAVIPPVTAALSVGRAWVRMTAEAPFGRQAWLWSVAAAAAFLAVNILLLPLLFVQFEPTPDLMRITGTLFLGAAMLAIPVHRLCLALGARSILQRH